MVLLHGALATAAQFGELVPLLPGADVVRLDFAGHGTGPDTAYDVDRFAADVLAAIGDGPPAELFGYSMGGYVALHVARTAPGRVARVTTLGTKLAWTPETAEREARRLDDPDRLLDRAPAFARSLERLHPGPGWRTVLARTAAFLRGLGAAPVVTDASLRETTVPVTIAVGDRDEMVTIEESVAAYRALPQGRLAVLPGTPHAFDRVPLAPLAGLLLQPFDSSE